MGASEFTGMRKVTVRTASDDFVVFGADKISADGFMAAIETNELTTSSFAGDTVEPNGTNVSATTITLLPKTIADLGDIWPEGWDETQESWQPPIGGCVTKDVTFCFEKVCDTKGNVILRHASVGLGAEFSFTRDDSLAVEVSVYPTLSLGSEYDLTGDKATQMFPFQFFNGVYDPTTDEIAYDSEAT